MKKLVCANQVTFYAQGKCPLGGLGSKAEADVDKLFSKSLSTLFPAVGITVLYEINGEEYLFLR